MLSRKLFRRFKATCWKPVGKPLQMQDESLKRLPAERNRLIFWLEYFFAKLNLMFCQVKLFQLILLLISMQILMNNFRSFNEFLIIQPRRLTEIVFDFPTFSFRPTVRDFIKGASSEFMKTLSKAASNDFKRRKRSLG